ncbi:MAG: methyl-accepting chemotaxis protein [Firmicutes bacterium]|nr:methyl-accepting chemotaxis protein [Bacillota bacterium]
MKNIISKITNIISKITTLIRKVNQGLISALSRLKVFYQILIVIVVMVLFLAIEGLMSLSTINSMQTVAKAVFNEGTIGYDDVYGASEYMAGLERNYLLALNQNTPVTFSYSGGMDNFTLLKKIDERVFQVIIKQFEEIDKIIKQPVSWENYEKIHRHAYLISVSIQQLRGKVSTNSSQYMYEGNKKIEAARRNTFLILLASLAVSIFLGLVISSSVSRPLGSIVTAANSLATGDLSLKIHSEGCQEAVEVIKGLNNATAGLRKLVDGINQQSQILHNSSKTLMEASGETGRASEESAIAMSDLAKSVTQQTAEISLITRFITEANELVQKVSMDLEEIAATSVKAGESATHGQNLNNEIVEEINALFVSTNEIANVVNELNRNSGRIGNITSLIEDLADQIQLLALNAAIEAARAGEYGKGFSVVANQTGKLADQSKQAAQMIAELINKTGDQVRQAVTIINKELARVENGRLLAKKAAGAFDEIFAELRDILARIDTTAVLAKEMAGKNRDVSESVLNISALSEETMASTEEVSANAEQQSAASLEVSRMAADLEAIAGRLQQSITVFSINKEKEEINRRQVMGESENPAPEEEVTS